MRLLGQFDKSRRFAIARVEVGQPASTDGDLDCLPRKMTSLLTDRVLGSHIDRRNGEFVGQG